MRRNLPPGSAICSAVGTRSRPARYCDAVQGPDVAARLKFLAPKPVRWAPAAVTSHAVGKLTFGVGDLLDKFDDRSPNFCIGNLHKCLGEIGIVRRDET
jgi:hypothetical protein